MSDAASDEYRELAEAAKDALFELIHKTEPGTGWPLHQAYAHLKQMLKPNEIRTERWERKPDWQTTFSMAEREAQVLGILSTVPLTIRGVMERLEQTHEGVIIYQGNVRSVITKLHKMRELDREQEIYHGSLVRFRYFKRTELDGAIAEIDRAFDAEGGEA